MSLVKEIIFNKAARGCLLNTLDLDSFLTVIESILSGAAKRKSIATTLHDDKPFTINGDI